VALSRAKSFLSVVAARQEDLSSAAVQQLRETLKSKATPDVEAAFKLLLEDWSGSRAVEDDLVGLFLISMPTNSRSWNGTHPVSVPILVARLALVYTTCGLGCVRRF
jgi:hypothetical protein